MSGALVEVDQLEIEFRVQRSATVHAVRDVSFSIGSNEAVALIGESGSGKTTIGRAVLGLTTPTRGSVYVDGAPWPRRPTLAERRRVQAVFQDPTSTLNPRRTVRSTLGELIRRFSERRGAALDTAVRELLDRVHLDADFAGRYPHELSGGQRQRVAIARALVPEPDLIVCDEALSALDVSTQARIIDLLLELQRDTSVSYLFISHDIGPVERLAQRVAVLYLGQVMEIGPVDDVLHAPAHPYTKALLAAVPVPDPIAQRARRDERRRLVEVGEPPSPTNPPSGCAFHPRCPQAIDQCRTVAPATTARGTREVRCHLVATPADFTAPPHHQET